MKSNRKFTSAAAVFCAAFVLLSCLLCGCTKTQSYLLPTGGYDYRMTAVDGAILGYPIPRKGSNSYTVSLPLTDALPPAFAYDAGIMEYLPLETVLYPLALGQNTVAVPAAVIDDGMTFFASLSPTEHITVCEGDIDGMAVVLDTEERILYLADSTHAAPIAEHVVQVLQVYTQKDRILFSDDNGVLFEYRHNHGTVQLSVGGGASDAWYAYGTDHPAVVFVQTSPDTGLPVRYYTEDGGAPIPTAPLTADAGETLVYVRGTTCALIGNSDTAYFYDIRTGDKLDMDMGGLYRFPQNTDTVSLPLSPDGHFVYFDDINYIYRLNLTTADLALAYNEALIFEGACVLSSMTAVTDEIVLLSQGSNEYTEFVPTVTCAVFEEDIPEVRHEHDRIDLDYHPWQTDD